MSLLPSLASFDLAPAYDNYPKGRYIQIFLLRTTRSEAVFRTEGTGEPMCRELVDDGVGANDRVVITKRKQVAVERRTGREMLRQENLLFPRKEDGSLLCSLNTNDPCERCIDCFLYGFAAGGGGAQRSRVITEDAFSVLPAGEVIDTRTFNAIFENGTMRNPETGAPSQALSESEYVRPGVHFLDVEVLRDVTEAELCYVLGNILRSTRYGAIGSRVGRVDNEILGVAFAKQELDSNLEWLRATWKALAANGHLRHPLSDDVVRAQAHATAARCGARAVGGVKFVQGEALSQLLREVNAAWEQPGPWLKAQTDAYPAPAAPKKGKK